MAEELIDLLDLDRAWKLARADARGRNFVTIRPEVELVHANLESWLGDLHVAMATGAFNPQSALLVEVPKPGGHVRPGIHLELEDQVVFAALAIAALPHLEKAVTSSLEVDLSYKINDDGVLIFKKGFGGWREFRKKTTELLADDGEYSHCIVADVTACYENVDLGILGSDLRDAGVPPVIQREIARLLNRWARGEKGIPQGHSAADALGKLYLTKVDQQIQAAGHRHLRYVDDIRIFCRSEVEAKRALVELAEILRNRGLNLQSAKSKILTREEAKNELDGTIETIAGVKQELVAELQKQAEEVGEYADMDEIDALLAEKPEQSLPVLVEAFDSQIVGSEKWDKSLFHFLLNRLAAAKSAYAAQFSLGLLWSRPEETDHVLKYLAGVGTPDEFQAGLAEFLTDPEKCVYPYQQYQILSWILRGKVSSLSPSVLEKCRHWAFNTHAKYPYLRRVARLTLGRYGEPGDLESLKNAYSGAEGSTQQVEIVLSLHRLETGLRNGFMARVQLDNPWNRLAVPYVREKFPDDAT